MLFRRAIFLSLTAALLCLAGHGCTPRAEIALDEQKDPYYLSGLNRRRDLDFKGAIEAFEKALEINPRSASAHYELAIIYDQQEKDYAAALYHYDRVMKLRPNNAYPADNATQRIAVCKQELAKTVSLSPMIQTMTSDMIKLQADLARLTNENLQLKKQLEAAQLALGSRGQPMQIVTNFSGPSNLALRLNLSANRTNPPPPGKIEIAGNIRANPPSTGQGKTPQVVSGRSTDLVTPKTKTYTVVSGDYPATIARKHGVQLAALMAANPHLDPKRLKPGQTLNIPLQ